MTAQIAIMNKEAIALASDSAVTMARGTDQKIFTSANKLFALSKYHPIGIMVYGAALFMGVHWETIVKTYRSKLGKQKFDTLGEYAANLIGFLDGASPLFPENQQKNYFYANTSGYFRYQIKADIDEQVKAMIVREGEITDTQIKQITSDVIKSHYGDWEHAKMLPSIPKTHIKEIANKYSDIIDEAIKEVFEELPISRISMNRLRKMAASLPSKDVFPEEASGAVIAGFGEQDSFPSLKSFTIEGIYNNRLKYKEDFSRKIDFETTASIIAFAQREMVATFMEGIDPYLQDHIEGYLSEIFDKYPEILVENMGKLDDKEKRLLKKKLKEVSDRITNDFHEGLEAYKMGNYVDPVTNVVDMLPKDELAAMAESLVNLTSFKRKVTMESETVGGPVDVAVISKGDGFIWIKRKHYFEAQLNPQFFAKYYRESWDEEE